MVSLQWIRKRENTYRSFCIVAICHGAEYSILVPSLWFYLENVIQTNDPKSYYGLTLASFYVSSILASFTISFYVDKTRNVRSTLICLLCVEIFGNVLYTVYTSVYFPLVARFIQGVADVNMSIIIAELARSYPVKECTNKILSIVTCVSLSIVIAPALNVVFKYVDFTVYGFTVNYGNFPAVFMAILNCFALSNVIVHVSDLSKEYDLKKETHTETASLETDSKMTKGSNEDVHICEGEEALLETAPLNTDSNDQGTMTKASRKCYQRCEHEKALLLDPSNTDSNTGNASGRKHSYNPWELCMSFDYVLLVLLGCFMSFNIVAFLDVSMPIIASTFFGLTSQAVGVLFFATGLLFILTLQVVKRICNTTGEYVLLFIGLGVFTASIVLLYIVLVMKHNMLSLILFIGNVLLLGESWSVEQVFVRAMLAKMVPSEYQSFGEGLRRIGSSLGCILSSLVVPLIFRWLSEACIGVILITVLFMLILFLRRSTLTKFETIRT